MRYKILCIIIIISLFILMAIPSFAIPLDYEVTTDNIVEYATYYLKPSIDYSLLNQNYSVAIRDDLGNTYDRLTYLTDGSTVLISTTNNQLVLKLYDKDGNRSYNGTLQPFNLGSGYLPQQLLDMFNGYAALHGSYQYISNDSSDLISLSTNFTNFTYNGNNYTGAIFYNDVLSFVGDHITTPIVNNGNFVVSTPFTITFEDVIPLSITHNVIAQRSLSQIISNVVLPSTSFFVFDNQPFYYVDDIIVEMPFRDVTNTMYTTLIIDNNYIGPYENQSLIYNGYEYVNKLFALPSITFDRLSEYGYYLPSYDGNDIAVNLRIGVNNTNVIDFVLSSTDVAITVERDTANGLESYNVDYILSYDGLLYSYDNSSGFERIPNDVYINLEGNVSTEFYSIISSIGNIFPNVPTVDSVTDFFENLFSLPERAMSALTLFVTPNGTTITLFSVVSTAISLCFIFWILKLIAGG